jgi:hypothetical protein
MLSSVCLRVKAGAQMGATGSWRVAAREVCHE